MEVGFESVPFQGKPVVWTDRHRTSQSNSSFYHWHQCCEILIVFEGTGTVVMNNKTYSIKKGMLFVFQPFEIHKVFAKVTHECPYERAVIHINHSLMDQYLKEYPRRRAWFDRLCHSSEIERAFDFSREMNLFNYCLEDYGSIAHKEQGDSQEEITVFILQFLSAMARVFPKNQLESTLTRRKKEHSELIMQWLDEHYMESDILNKLADHLHFTRSYVSRLFKKETGSNLSEYLAAKRIKVAAHLLETTFLPVEVISHHVGFQNVSHFISCFKKTYEITPLKYKLKQKKNGL
ncbi:AraC-like DNA-binding protein [Paenibacillus pabuli]|uniref:AraC-like DNA-binding protein n=1 Tax=Paenibacillus pabuli TaxID=1472 RepID=A0ABX9BMQ8_9BACL|nr:AraC family transcriptional regulator [Paenibacillus pabuli]RAI98331.1 AraC-like DNA-binding protein [Paenibacillus pabuli]